MPKESILPRSPRLTDTHAEAWRREVAARSDDTYAFLKYFDNAASIDESWTRGFWDFSYHVLKPRLLPLIGEPFDKTALEIGYGGGRLLNAACHYFGNVVGVDIHGQGQRVSDLLKESGVSNFELHQTDGLSYSLPDGSVDFAYSFIVFQHLPTIQMLKSNLGELHRVMRPGAVGILYFGYLRRGLLKPARYVDLDSATPDSVNDVTLRVSIPYMKRLLRENRFSVLETKRSHKHPWLRRYGGQFYAMIERI